MVTQEATGAGKTEESGKIEPTKIGDYEFQEDDSGAKLGEGRFGIVYRARNLTTGTYVALKKVPTEKFRSKEVQSIRNLRHKNIVFNYPAIHWGEWTYIPMEICDMDLGIFLEKYGRLNTGNLEKIGQALASGNMGIHSINIVHRDIKPQNILLNVTTPSPTRMNSLSRKTQKLVRQLSGGNWPHITEGEIEGTGGNQPDIQTAKITDFGCSRRVQDSEEACMLAGTFYYMAPEVGANLLDENSYSAAVDLWSTGVVLFESIKGSLPYDESALCKLFLRAAEKNYIGFSPPPLCPQEGPNKFRDVVSRLVQLDPELRLSSADMFSALVTNLPLPELKNSRESSKGSKFSLSSLASKKSNDSYIRRISSGNIRKSSSGGCGVHLEEEDHLGNDLNALTHAEVGGKIAVTRADDFKASTYSMEDKRPALDRLTDKLMYYCCCCCCMKNVG